MDCGLQKCVNGHMQPLAMALMCCFPYTPHQLYSLQGLCRGRTWLYTSLKVHTRLSIVTQHSLQGMQSSHDHRQELSWPTLPEPHGIQQPHGVPDAFVGDVVLLYDKCQEVVHMWQGRAVLSYEAACKLLHAKDDVGQPCWQIAH